MPASYGQAKTEPTATAVTQNKRWTFDVPPLGNTGVSMLNHWQAEQRFFTSRKPKGTGVLIDSRDIGEPYHDLAPRAEFVDLDIAALAMACIEDAVRVLREGIHHNSQQAINEAAYWMFYDDPTGDRVFSLSWCVGAINTFTGVGMDANWIRERASRWLPRFKAKRKHKIYVREGKK